MMKKLFACAALFVLALLSSCSADIKESSDVPRMAPQKDTLYIASSQPVIEAEAWTIPP
jgi:hypothetical protein